jgi:DNA processing protein
LRYHLYQTCKLHQQWSKRQKMDELKYWLGFNLVRGIGPVRLRRLIKIFGDIETAWNAPTYALKDAKLSQRVVNNLLKVRSTFDEVAVKIIDRLNQLNVQVITWDSPEYPDLLRQIHNHPAVLFVRGQLIPEDEWAVAMVGTRKATVYGREVARRLASDLVHNGITVVSGLARGIDGASHRAALEAGGRTIAVLGSGIDVIYPSDHRELANQIINNGALISEFPLGTKPEAPNFPARNRIISGLSLGTVVVEAGWPSGAFITAELALDQNREVFAVPGSILSPASEGCNRLLQEGAAVVTDVRDILETLRLSHVSEKQSAREILPENANEAELWHNLSAEPRHLDDLARSTSMPVELVSSTLVMMELKGMIRQVGSLQYVRVREEGVVYEPDSNAKKN